MHKSLISIITPTFNHENYIAECIESVLCQTYDNWEMIIVDDASQDDTLKIAKKYAEKDERIKVIEHDKNYGPFYLDKTYNEALSISKGEWIAILEGDDVWPPYRLEYQLKIIPSIENIDKVVVFHGRCALVQMHSDLITFRKESLDIPINKPYNSQENLIYGINPVYSQTVLIRKHALDTIGGFHQYPRSIRLVDFPTWLELSQIGYFYYTPKILGFWRRHSQSLTMNYHIDIATSYKVAIKQFLKNNNLENKYSESCIGVIQNWGSIYFSILSNDFESAKKYLEELKECPNIRFSKEDKIKALIYELSILLKTNKLVKIAYKIKTEKLDTVIEQYYPFFFRDKSFIQKLEKLDV